MRGIGDYSNSEGRPVAWGQLWKLAAVRSSDVSVPQSSVAAQELDGVRV